MLIILFSVELTKQCLCVQEWAFHSNPCSQGTGLQGVPPSPMGLPRQLHPQLVFRRTVRQGPACKAHLQGKPLSAVLVGTLDC